MATINAAVSANSAPVSSVPRAADDNTKTVSTTPTASLDPKVRETLTQIFAALKKDDPSLAAQLDSILSPEAIAALNDLPPNSKAAADLKKLNALIGNMITAFANGNTAQAAAFADQAQKLADSIAQELETDPANAAHAKVMRAFAQLFETISVKTKADETTHLVANVLEDPSFKNEIVNLKASLAAGKSTVAQTIAQAAKSIKDAMAKNMATNPDAFGTTGLFSAFNQIIANVSSVLSIQSTMAEWTSSIATMVQQLSDSENQQLNAITAQMNQIDAQNDDKAGSKIQQKQVDFQQVQLKYQNLMTVPQAQSQSGENAASDLSKVQTAALQNLSTISDLFKAVVGR